MLRTLTHCPPALATHESHVIHFNPRQPVSTRFTADGEESTGISFNDYERMQTIQRKTTGCRKTPTPEWVFNSQRFRAVVIRFLERKVSPRKRIAGNTPEELSRNLTQVLQQKAEVIGKALDEYCAQYVYWRQQPESAERTSALNKLQRAIREYDHQVRVLREPYVIADCIRLYYAVGMDSVGVAAELGFSSPWVRQMLYRINKLAVKETL